LIIKQLCSTLKCTSASSGGGGLSAWTAWNFTACSALLASLNAWGKKRKKHVHADRLQACIPKFD